MVHSRSVNSLIDICSLVWNDDGLDVRDLFEQFDESLRVYGSIAKAVVMARYDDLGFHNQSKPERVLRLPLRSVPNDRKHGDVNRILSNLTQKRLRILNDALEGVSHVVDFYSFNIENVAKMGRVSLFRRNRKMWRNREALKFIGSLSF